MTDDQGFELHPCDGREAMRVVTKGTRGVAYIQNDVRATRGICQHSRSGSPIWFAIWEEPMIWRLLKDLTEYVLESVGIAIGIVIVALLFLPLVWLEHHHHEALWVV